MSLANYERELSFVLFEMLETESLVGRERYAEHDRGTFEQAIATAHQIADDHFAPHNQDADHQEPSFDGSTVTVMPEVKEAIEHFAAAGFMAATHDYASGGMQLPHCIAQACMAQFYAANISTAAYPLLTIAASNLLCAHGNEEQIAQYLPAMLSGEALGTMCLSEPQAGSALAEIRTAATETQAGHYVLRGSKMWISAGDHELSDNIYHMVLARIDGAPSGVRGISLFLVPKFLVNADGSRGERNGVRLVGLNHKMGYRGTVNSVLSFGDEGECVGYLIGE
ncbi:MAG: acyl-CoA dehydrogenase family protein, partial [Pseudomonadota bacterium]